MTNATAYFSLVTKLQQPFSLVSSLNNTSVAYNCSACGRCANTCGPDADSDDGLPDVGYPTGTCAPVCCKKKYADLGASSGASFAETDPSDGDTVIANWINQTNIFTLARTMNAYAKYEMQKITNSQGTAMPMVTKMWYETVLRPMEATTAAILEMTPCTPFAALESRLITLQNIANIVIGPTSVDYTPVQESDPICSNLTIRDAIAAQLGYPPAVQMLQCPFRTFLLTFIGIDPPAPGSVMPVEICSVGSPEGTTTIFTCASDETEAMNGLSAIGAPVTVMLTVGEILSELPPALLSQLIKVGVASVQSVDPYGPALIAYTRPFFATLNAISALYTTMWNSNSFIGTTGKQNGRDCSTGSGVFTIGAWEAQVQTMLSLLLTYSTQLAALNELAAQLVNSSPPDPFDLEVGLLLQLLVFQFTSYGSSTYGEPFPAFQLVWYIIGLLSCWETLFIVHGAPVRLADNCCFSTSRASAPTCLPVRDLLDGLNGVARSQFVDGGGI